MFSYELLRTLTLAAMLAWNQSVPASNGALPTVDDLLKRHNIQLTQSALIDALTNADPEVRYLAAQKLAEDKAVDTIPLITRALTSEKVPWTRTNIAFALAQLGDVTGFDTLVGNCRSREAGAGVRVQSAEYMIRLRRQSEACLSAALDVLQNGTNGYRLQAAALLPQFPNLSEQDSERVFAALVGALHASYPLVRAQAGRALADTGDARAVAELSEAATAEQEPAIRLQMQEDLRMLQKKLHR